MPIFSRGSKVIRARNEVLPLIDEMRRENSRDELSGAMCSMQRLSTNNNNSLTVHASSGIGDITDMTPPSLVGYWGHDSLVN